MMLAKTIPFSSFSREVEMQVLCRLACVLLLLAAWPLYAQESAAPPAAPADAPDPDPTAEAVVETETPADTAAETTEAIPTGVEETSAEVVQDAEPENIDEPAEAEQTDADEEIPGDEAVPADTLVGNEAAPVSEACRERCTTACACKRHRAGGGPIFMILFNSFNSAYGDFDGPSFFFGGRGYTYLGDNDQWRIGGMGAGGFGENGENLKLSSDLFPISKSRRITGGYGGITAEYVFRMGDTIEFPLGFLLGVGGAGYDSELSVSSLDIQNVSTHYNRHSTFLAFQPMVGIDANVASFAKISVAMSYLLAEPFGEARLADGFAMIFGVQFGQFIPTPLDL